jgi:hypothetical protein
MTSMGFTNETHGKKDGITPELMLKVDQSIVSSIGALHAVGFPIEKIMNFNHNLKLLDCTLWSVITSAVKISLEDFENDEEKENIENNYDILVKQAQGMLEGILLNTQKIKDTTHEETADE